MMILNPARTWALLVSACVVCLASCVLLAEQAGSPSALLPPTNGPRQIDPSSLALVGATVHTEPGKAIAKGIVLIRDGVIADVLPESAAVPAGMSTRDVSGLHIYAGFIEPYLLVDVPRPNADAPGSHWSSRVVPQRSALDRGSSGVDAKTAETLRSLGFTSANIVPRGGIFQGSSALVSLMETPKSASEARPRVYKERATMGVAFETARDDDGAARAAREEDRWGRYPDSQMGAIALIRQTLSDADWQAGRRGAGLFKDTANALDQLSSASAGTLLFDCEDELEFLRAAKIAKEFSRPAMICGSGQEYRRLEAIKATSLPVILPLAMHKAPGVSTIGAAESVGLNELVAWEQAPTNPRRVDAAGIMAALTTSRIGDKEGGRGAFADRLGNAIKHGLAKDRALAMLTTQPAKMLGAEGTLGVVAPGAAANLVITENELFTQTPDAPKREEPGYIAPGRIIDVYVDGHRHPVAARQRTDLAGVWKVELEPKPKDDAVRTFRIEGDWPPTITVTKAEKPDAEPSKSKATGVAFATEPDGGLPRAFVFTFDHTPLGAPGTFSVSCSIDKDAAGAPIMRGELVRSDGQRARLVAKRTGDLPKDDKPTIAGTWTRVLADGTLARSDDDKVEHVVLSTGGDKKVIVRKGAKELAVEVVSFEPGDAAKKTEAMVVFKVKGTDAAKPDEALSVWLSPVKGNDDRLSVRLAADGAEAFRLGRSKETPEADAIKQVPMALGLPVGAYAFEKMPEQGTFILKNATIWTSSDKGVIENGTVIIGGGTIMFVGKADAAAEFLSRVRFGAPVTEIDCTGKFIAPGIIDCHSHTGISKGVNESGQAVTAEVRIGDVTDPDSISWYRQLAGGVTCVSNLHGSANPIGGQNQVNKIRWGCVNPDDMHFAGAIGGIKFALGENVKQSNWGDRVTARYPQTRMGVETLMRDRFTAAREYRDAWIKFDMSGFKVEIGDGTKQDPARQLSKDVMMRLPRRDLELEALAEIIDGRRLVHCHSYRQDEILMLCRVAKDFGFTIGTFQHGLECYKVADEVKKNAIGASIFTDWWAFKMEVQDAIPFAGPIMHEQGIPVSFNSDSDELARRMNVEAGKAAKYSKQAGGTPISLPEAYKFVTINPAKQLKIDNKVGSIEEGKDADVVVWSGVPTSSLSRCERTFVDGRELFSLEKDKAMRARNEAERRRLIQKVLTGGAAKAPKAKSAESGDDDSESDGTIGDDRASGRRSLIHEATSRAANLRRTHYLSLYLRGLDPKFYRSGDCGCEVWNLGN